MQYITWIVTKNSPLPLYLQREKLDDPLMKGYSSSPTKVTAAGIETTVTIGDAVRCGLDKAAVHPTVVIVGEDVDLIVLLMGLTQPNINVFFMKPERGKVETKLFSVDNFNSFHLPRQFFFSTASPDATPPPRSMERVKWKLLSCSRLNQT